MRCFSTLRVTCHIKHFVFCFKVFQFSNGKFNAAKCIPPQPWRVSLFHTIGTTLRGVEPFLMKSFNVPVKTLIYMAVGLYDTALNGLFS